MPSYRKLPSGLWQAQVYMPNGRRTTETFKLKASAVMWATELEAKYYQGDKRNPRAGMIHVADWFERWWPTRGIELATRNKDWSHWKTHCEQQWGTWPMDSITRLEAQTWVRDLEAKPRARHKGKDADGQANVPTIGAETIHTAVHLMSGLYTAAMRQTPPIVVVNPFDGLELPEIARGPVRYYEHDEAAALFDAIEKLSGFKWRVMAELTTYAALRLEESFGLHAHRVDWMRRSMHVTHVATRAGLREYPKNKKSSRDVPIPDEILERASILREHLPIWNVPCACPKVLAGNRRVPGEGPCVGLMFPSTRGLLMSDGNFRDRIWYPAVKLAGVPRYAPNTMRHTGASWLAQAGVPLNDIGELMGHDSPKTTQRYAHLKPGAHSKVREAWKSTQDHHARGTHGDQKAPVRLRRPGL